MKIYEIIKNKIGGDKLTMIQILARVRAAEYRNEYSQAVLAMAENGGLIRTWDESGMSFYEVPAPVNPDKWQAIHDTAHAADKIDEG